MKPPRALEKARQAARRGQTDEAIQGLRRFTDQGDAAASASLAELLAFRGQWEECIPHAERLLCNPLSVYAGNVSYDLVRLLARAGQETGFWPELEAVAGRIREHSEANLTAPHPRDQFARFARRLAEYAASKGTLPYRHVSVFGPPAHESFGGEPAWRQAREDTHRQVEELLLRRPKPTGHLGDTRSEVYRLFSLAGSYDLHEDLVHLHGHFAGPLSSFEQAVALARAFVLQHDAGQAWAILAENLRLWWPVDKAQVAPVVLLTDEHLHPLLTPERCALVLATPRGPEGQK